MDTLGWIVTGPIVNSNAANFKVHSALMNVEIDETLELTNLELSQQLRKFWEMDAVPTKKALSPEEELCEKFFAETYSRGSDGRYIVRLPFREKPDFPNSRKIAMSQIFRLKQKFELNLNLKDEYDKLMKDYLDLHHMEFVPDDEVENSDCYYIPHHAIFKNEKIRVVFNASFPNANRETLNDYFMIGPKLQTDSRLIIIIWRVFSNLSVQQTW